MTNYKFRSMKLPKIIFAYGIAALISLIIGLFSNGNVEFTDLKHNTTYYFEDAFIFTAIACLFVVFALITWGITKAQFKLSPILSWMHFGLTILSLVVLFYLLHPQPSEPRRYYNYSVYSEFNKPEPFMQPNDWITVSLLLFLLIQFVFLTNMVRAFVVIRK